jgi:hypothetical protein
MDYSIPSNCPVCGEKLNITKLSCPKCKTDISGKYGPCIYCGLDERMRLFLDTFLKCRGSIKEVEKALNISYPTVKSLLDELLKTLFLQDFEEEQGCVIKSSEVLDMLEKGEISAREAAELLSKAKEK